MMRQYLEIQIPRIKMAISNSLNSLIGQNKDQRMIFGVILTVSLKNNEASEFISFANINFKNSCEFNEKSLKICYRYFTFSIESR